LIHKKHWSFQKIWKPRNELYLLYILEEKHL